MNEPRKTEEGESPNGTNENKFPCTQTTDGKGIERITKRSELTTENTKNTEEIVSARGEKGNTELNKSRLTSLLAND